MKKSRLLAILLCLTLLLPLAACGNAQNSNSPPAASGASQGGPPASQAPDASQAPGTSNAPAPGEDTITVALRSDSGSLNAVTMTTDTFAAVCCIQEPLWDVTEANQVIMLLAESVDQVGPTEWKAHLRQGVKFSNGNPLTTDDVIFSFQLHKEAGATGGPRVQNMDLEQTKAIDDNTVDLRFLDSSVANWTLLSQTVIYDKESFDPAKASTNPIGTGPYVLKEYVPNSNVNLVRNDSYWGTKPDAKYLNFRILAETAQRTNAIETGLVNIAPIAIPDVEYVKSLSGFNVDSRYTGNFIQMGFNFGENSVFYQNPDARRAITHAINPQAIIDTVYLGQGKIMHMCVPDICFDYDTRFDNMDDTYKIGYNPDLGKQLAGSSGLTGKTVKMMTDGSAEAVASAQIIQNMCSAIGINVEINNYDPATTWKMMFDAAAVWDMSVGAGIAPNRRVGDQLVNGVRYSPTLSAPGAFEGVEDYLKTSPLTMSTLDDKQRFDILVKALAVYEGQVMNFALCNVLYSNAYSKSIDQNSVVYSIGTGSCRFMDLKFAS
jgi:peptide/nickel transport system substrate-binding protein